MRTLNCAKNAEIFYGFIVEHRKVNTECGNKLTQQCMSLSIE